MLAYNECMAGKRNPDVVARMEVAFELFDAAEEMMRLNLKRRHPQLSDEEIEQRIIEWLQHRPGAELGDAWGRPMTNFQLEP